jgi:hypothetical protein
VSNFRRIWILLLHIVVKRVRNSTARFRCVFGSTGNPQSRDSSVGTPMGYGLDDRGSRVRFLAGAGNFSLNRRVQNGSGAHPASHPIGSRGSFPGG